MLKKVCAGCARLAIVGFVAAAVARFFQKRREAERKPLLHRLIPH